jgi:flagellar hook-basal body complex protein FliE
VLTWIEYRKLCAKFKAMSEALDLVLDSINEQSKDVEALRLHLESATKANAVHDVVVNTTKQEPRRAARLQLRIHTTNATNRWNGVNRTTSPRLAR